MKLTPLEIVRAAGFRPDNLVQRKPRWWSSVPACACGVAIAILMGAVCARFQVNLALGTSFYLLLIAYFASRIGFWEASVICMAVALCEMFFFTPPIYHWRVGDPYQLLAILISEAATLLISRISARERSYACEMAQQKQKLQNLYAIMQGALLLETSTPPEAQLAELLCTLFKLDAVLIHNAEANTFGLAGSWVGLDPNHLYFELLTPLSEREKLERQIAHVELFGGGTRGHLVTEGDMTDSTLTALGPLLALILDRHGASTRESRAEAARQAEQLRVTVLDSLAHAFKTPLTVIRAASSGLLEDKSISTNQRQLAGLIDENAAKMTDLATRLLKAARIGPEDVRLKMEAIDVGVLLNDIVHHVRSNLKHTARNFPQPRIHLTLPVKPVRVPADYGLLRATVTELVENALKYSEPGKPVTLRASYDSTDVMLAVHSWSGVIPESDSNRIFERFYRGSERSDEIPGTGLGLSIAHMMTQVHKGEIWVESLEDEGTTFYISLPCVVERLSSVAGTSIGYSTIPNA